MTSSLTLLFVRDRAEYPVFLSELRAADFEVLTARSVTQAKSLLLTRRVDAVILRHDGVVDDRPLASTLKRIAPQASIFLLSDETQPRPDEIDAILRGDFGDAVIVRAVAALCRVSLISRLGRTAAAFAGPLTLPFARFQPRSVS